MELVFLGTSSMVPTKDRNASSIFLKFENEGILFDCGEGTQRQMNIAGINRNSVTLILISHWHGDHVGGLVGLLQTLSNGEENKTIKIFGPIGTKEHFDHLLKMCVFENKVNVEITELEPKEKEEITVIDKEKFHITTVKLEHSTPCIGYSFYVKDKLRIRKTKLDELNIPDGPHLQKLIEGQNIEYKGKKVSYKDVTYIVQGKKISFIWDTGLCTGCDILAKESDILICEATHLDNLAEKAHKYKHLTAQQAAQIASRNDAKKLYLTHFSQRYNSVEEIQKEAQDIFPETVCAFDFLKIKKF
ncbi:ribonuclease Z [Candidatus Woesearchaeota archaeon]|nr:ribonuclease Z [Candidatus Woesearchaeota archaeon]